MDGLTRRGLLAGAGGVAIGTCFNIGRAHAQNAEFTYKFGHTLAVTHPMHLRAQEAAERIKADSKGRMELQVFPSSQLGSETDMLSQLRSGALEFFTMSPLTLSTLVPNAAINGIGFAFPDYDTVWKAMDGDLGAYVRELIAKAGLIAMEKIWDNGFRQITSWSRPIQTPDDLRGFKLRVPPSPLWTSMFKAFGAAPTTINFNELYSSLQTRIVEGQENPLTIIWTAKLYEVQKYCSLSNHMWDGFWFLANRRAWGNLPDDLRKMAATHINEAGLAVRADLAKLSTNLQQELTTKGLAFNQTETSKLREALRRAGFYAEWKAKFGDEAWQLLEKSVGKLS